MKKFPKLVLVLQDRLSRESLSLDPRPYVVRKGLVENLVQRCLERWNAAIGVDEVKCHIG